MGIVNLTPDSFSDGGQFGSAAAAIAHCERLVAEGADLLDLGAESSRPGAARIDADESGAAWRLCSTPPCNSVCRSRWIPASPR